MNAHPHSVQLATEPEAPALPDAPRFAQNLMQAAKILVPVFEAGRSIDAAALRAAMEDACGASDTSGAWVWKDAYEAAEVAQILILCNSFPRLCPSRPSSRRPPGFGTTT